MISILVNSGNACHKQRISPAILGQEKEVPLPAETFPAVFASVVPWPTETIFGFILPAPLGPQLLNEAILPAISTAPTSTTLSPSAGQDTYLKSSTLVP